MSGKPAANEQFPWMGLLEFESVALKTKIFMCGGTLISKRYVMTGECFDSFVDLTNFVHYFSCSLYKVNKEQIVRKSSVCLVIHYSFSKK